jgi:predicted adenylyl cyclase CyaB
MVEKVRSLYIVGQTRIHIDQVKGLGSFLEIEVVLKEQQSDAEGLHIAQTLAQEFGIMESHLIHVAYVDLVRQRSGSLP